MQHDAQLAAQTGLLHLANVPSVDLNSATVNVVEPREQVDRGGLTRSRRPYQGYRLPRLGGHAYILEHGHAGQVTEVHVIEDHLASDVIQHDGVGCIG